MIAVSPPPPLPPAGAARPVRVHGLEEARTALAAAAALGVPLVLVGPPGGGALWLLRMVAAARAAFPETDCTVVQDCGDRVGEALGAIAAGARHILFTGCAEVAARLASIAAGTGAAVLTALPPALDLRDARDPASACRAWLARPHP